jgi:hypothetical protein
MPTHISAPEDPHGIADVQRPRDQLVRRVPAQLEQRRDLRVIPDAERVEEARHAADHDIAGRRADWPAVPARRDHPGDDHGDLDGREAGIDDHQSPPTWFPPRPMSHLAKNRRAPVNLADFRGQLSGALTAGFGS